jgi:NADPH:quinone reductase-like Zn-dependent oxidoreductase
MAAGLARSVRCETASKFITVDFSSSEDDETVTGLCSVYKAIFDYQDPSTTEFRYRGHALWTPRIVQAPAMDKYIYEQTNSAARQVQPFQQADRPLKLVIESPGALDSMYFAEDVISRPLEADEVEINIKATAMNFKDVMIAMGQLGSPYLGIECSGVISRVGSAVRDLEIGDRVVAMSEGAYSSYTSCRSTSVHRIPPGMNFEEASTIPVIYCTAFYSLFDLARLEKGERVLIHAAAGGVGQAAVALCQYLGAEIFVTVGSQSKKKHLMETFGLREDHILYSRDTEFATEIMRLTGNAGIDVVLNSLAGDFLQETWKCLSSFGRFIEIGKKDIVNNSYLEMGKFAQNVTFASVDLTLVAAERPALMKRILTDVFALIEKGVIRPITPITRFPINDVEAAFRMLQGGKAMGKIVVTANEEDKVKVCRSSRNSTTVLT